LGIGIAIAVLVIVGAGIGALALRGSSTRYTPRTAVEEWLKAAAAADAVRADSLTCAVVAGSSDADPGAMSNLTWQILGLDGVDDSSARATVVLTGSLRGQPSSVTVMVGLVKRDGDWKVCSIDAP
jgi:hypothetical protein